MSIHLLSGNDRTLIDLLSSGLDDLKELDNQLYSILGLEHSRQMNELMMVASCSIVPAAVLICQAMSAGNVTAEGYPGKRYHAGCGNVDSMERMAVERAKQAFHAQYANVQPHSASSANQIVLFSLLNPGDTILGLNMPSGGHLSHGARISYSGTCFNAVSYGLTEDFLIDYDQVERLAVEHRPKLIICGTTAYPRQIDFKRFRDIADQVGAYLLADISHTAGLVIAGLHPSPIDYAHITTTCTHKQLFGPRGGLILSGKDAGMFLDDKNKTLAEHLQKAVFPFFQGAPIPNMIAAKAAALQMTQTGTYLATMQRIVDNARTLSAELKSMGFDVITQGTDTHIVLLDMTRMGITGTVAERGLEQCGVIVNKNNVPNRGVRSNAAMGIRLGTNSLSQRGFGPAEMRECAAIISEVTRGITGGTVDTLAVKETVRKEVKAQVQDLCNRFPFYPL